MASPGRLILRGFLLLAVPVAGALGAAYYYETGGRYVTTENAYVKTGIVSISPEIDGRVIRVSARDNQPVEIGDPLFELDPAPFTIALDAAEAELAAVRHEIDSLRARHRESRMELAAAEEQVRFLKLEYQRQQLLDSKGIGTRTKYERAEHGLAMAQRRIPVYHERIQTILADLGGAADLPIERHPLFLRALAARDRAALDLARTSIVAPAAGYLSNVTLQIGEHVEAGDAVFALVTSGDVWIEANLKEIHLTHIKVGQTATFVLDAYPDVEWRAVVDSISPATGAEFALLPPQNASGNWVKVVQRVPVRLTIERRGDGPPLRAGMTVSVSIDSGFERDLGALVRRVLARTLDGADESAAQSQ